MGSQRSLAVPLAIALAVLSLSAAPSLSQTARPKYVDPGLAGALDDLVPRPAIAVLDPTWEASTLQTLANRGIPHRFYDHLHMASVLIFEREIDEVADLPGVRTLYRNEEMHILLSVSAPYVGANILWNTYELTGEGVTVLVVDTGVDGSHPDVRYGENLRENVVPSRVRGGLVVGYSEGVVSSDSDGHGTHVAGVVAGTAKAGGSGDSDAGKYHGVAWGADLVGFQAGLTDPSSGDSSFDSVTVLEAYNYALDKKEEFGIRIVTNSWGANGPFDAHSPVNLATLRLYRAGLVVVFASGNEGADGPGSLNRYSVAPWVLGVAAGDYRNRRASFSSIGTDPETSGKPYDHPDLMAPGVQITAAKASMNGGPINGLLQPKTGLYTSKSGTSMAAPHVAGVAALLLSGNPDLSPDQVYDVLAASATPLFDVPAWEGGAGYLDALTAFRMAGTLEGNLAEFLAGDVKYGGALTGDSQYAADPVTIGLGNNSSRQLQADVDLGQFARNLVGTTQGLTFVAGTALLALLAFRWRRED